MLIQLKTVVRGAEAGLQKGDVITGVDGKKITKMAELQEYLANKRPGDKVTITYMRDKKSKNVTVTLKNEQGNTNVVKKADLDILGGNFREINDSEKKQAQHQHRPCGDESQQRRTQGCRHKQRLHHTKGK